MLSVVKSVGATAANGALPFVYQKASGVLTGVYSLSFQILDATLTQIFPVTPGNKQSVDLVTGLVGVGRYNATWTPGGGQAVGRYYVRYFYLTAVGQPERTFDQEFELVTAPYVGRNYCMVQDVRDEGLMTSAMSDANAQRAIIRASKYVEYFTGRRFLPEYRTLECDGATTRALLLGEPIVAIEVATISYVGDFAQTSPVDLSNVRIYNRHLTQGLSSPDDRDNPKMEFVHQGDMFGYRDQWVGDYNYNLTWPDGRRNVQVVGLFGYTEGDGSFIGQTPDLVREACKLLVFRNLKQMIKNDASRYGILQESTRDQSVAYAKSPDTSMTGDHSIDSILAGFRRGPIIGGA